MATQPTVGVITSRHVTAIFKDGTGTPLTLNAAPGPGDLAIPGFEEGNKATTPIYNSGVFLERVYGQDNLLACSLTLYMIGDLTGHSIIDWIMKTNDFSAGVTLDPGGEVWSGTVVVTMVRAGQRHPCR